MTTKTLVFGPAWHKPPLQHVEAVPLSQVADDGSKLSRGHVEVRLKLRRLDQVEYPFEFVSRYVGYESTAHDTYKFGYGNKYSFYSYEF